MPQVDTNRNLLFAIMAVQMDFVPRDVLFSAMVAWTDRKDLPLGQILVDRGELSLARRSLLDQLLDEHIKAHAGDPAQSLEALSSTDEVGEVLTRIPDAALQASLGHLRSVQRSLATPDTAAPLTDTPTMPPTSVGPLAPWTGRFRVVRPHAKGGLGVVSVAMDEELDREVAFKEIQARYADHPTSQARFLLEAEITGKLEHPGIVPIYGLGHDPIGRPYYAMRFIRGESLKDAIHHFHDPEGPYRDPSQRALQLRELLGRFLDVCDALAYAHSRGVLHRDLKPGNVMLGPFGETLVVDWGLALPLNEIPHGHESTHGPLKTSRTELGSLPSESGTAVGTPQYMPPEQAEGALDQLGPRSDVYGLGAILYDLLTGRHPVTGETQSDVLKAVREGQILPPRQVRPDIPPALEAICLKALSLRPENRYGTPRALATDIKSWLADEPVSAYREPALDRARRWAKRHRVMVTSLAASLVVGFVGIGAVAIVQTRARRDLTAANLVLDQQRRRAEDREQQAIDAVKKFRDVVVNEPLLKNTKELEALRKRLLQEPLAFFQSLRQLLQADNDTRPESLDRLANAAFELGVLTDEIGDKSDAIVAHEVALKTYKALATQNPTVTRYQSDLARSHNSIGYLLSATGKNDDALKSYNQALDIRKALAKQNPTVTQHQSDLAASHLHIGLLLSATGKNDDALKSYNQALDIRKALATQNPTDTGYQRDLAVSHDNIGNLLSDTGKPDDALKSYNQALDIEKALATQNPTVTQYQHDLAYSHHSIGLLLSGTGKNDDALKAYNQALDIQKALATQNPTVTQYQHDLAYSHHNIGNLLSATGKPDDAFKSYNQALEIRKALATQNPTVTAYQSDLAASHNNIGVLLSATGKTDDALKSYKQALDIQQALATQNPAVTEYQSGLARSHNNIGYLLSATGKTDDALKSYKQALDIQQALATQNPTVTEYQSDLARSHNNIGLLLSDTGRKDDALKAYEQANSIQERLASEHPKNPEYASELGGTLNNLAMIDMDATRFTQARKRLGEAIIWQRKALATNPAHPTFRRFMKNNLTNLWKTCLKLDDRDGVAEAERELKALADSDLTMRALDARLAAILKGGQKPRDGAERLQLAQRAYDKSLHASAAKLWDEALKAAPKLAEDREAQIPYNAACAAALAGTGRGKDEPAPTEKEKAVLRGQAMTWLKGELRAWETHMGSGQAEAKKTVVETLRHWKLDADLAGVREEKELAKLPEAERTEWETFWKEVERMRAKVK